jgi:glycosyltransferase involved in cell wall biosynthesis
VKLLYIVPSLKFFSEGYRGRVMHALGIIEGYVQNGWEVSVIGGNELSSFKHDIPHSVNIHEIKEPEGLLKMFKWWYLICRKYSFECRNQEYDTVMVRYVISSFLVSIYIAIFKPLKSKSILEVNCFAFHALHRFPKWLTHVVAMIEMTLVNNFQLLYVVSKTMLNDPRNRYCKSPTLCVLNGATTNKIVSDYNNKFTTPKLVYFGTLMPYWDFLFFIDAINYLHQKIDVDVIFLGDGPERELLQNNLKKKELITFFGQFSRNDLGKYISKESDILIYPPKTKEDMLLTGGISTKLFDYLSMQMPILAPSDGEINTVLFDRRNALLYKSDEVASFSKCVQVLLQDKSLRKNISNDAFQDFSNKYSWRARMKTIIDGCNG